MHHTRADTECLNVKKENDRSFIQLELKYKTTAIGLKKYIDTTVGWMLQWVNMREKQKKKY